MEGKENQRKIQKFTKGCKTDFAAKNKLVLQTKEH